MSEAVDYVALLTAVPSVLVVGDESFEFSLGRPRRPRRGARAPRWLCATAYEAAPVDAAAATRAAELGCLGAVVRQGVDATRLEGMHLCEPSIQVDWIPPPAFGAVVFNPTTSSSRRRRPGVDDVPRAPREVLRERAEGAAPGRPRRRRARARPGAAHAGGRDGRDAPGRLPELVAIRRAAARHDVRARSAAAAMFMILR